MIFSAVATLACVRLQCVKSHGPPQKTAGKDAIENKEKGRHRDKNVKHRDLRLQKYKDGEGDTEKKSDDSFYIAKIFLNHIKGPQ